MKHTKVTCHECLLRQQKCYDLDVDPKTIYDIGNPARPDMGHAMYFTSTGRIALCIAKLNPK